MCLKLLKEFRHNGYLPALLSQIHLKLDFFCQIQIVGCAVCIPKFGNLFKGVKSFYFRSYHLRSLTRMSIPCFYALPLCRKSLTTEGKFARSVWGRNRAEVNSSMKRLSAESSK